MTMRKKLSWRDRVCPKWAFSLYDAAERLQLSPRHVRRLLVKYDIPTGVISRPVRMGDGRIVSRRLTTLTQSGLQQLLLSHGGFDRQ